jgi:hypothetical protein
VFILIIASPLLSSAARPGGPVSRVKDNRTILQNGGAKKVRGGIAPRAALLRAENVLVEVAQHALRAPTFAARNEQHADAVARHATTLALVDAQLTASAEDGLFLVMKQTALRAGDAFKGAFDEAGVRQADNEAIYKRAVLVSSRIAVEEFPSALMAIAHPAGLKGLERLAVKREMTREATRVIRGARLADVIEVVERSLGQKIDMTEQQVFDLIKANTPLSDHFYGQVNDIPLRHTGEVQLSKSDVSKLAIGLELAYSAWGGAQIHRSAWEGKNDRLDPRLSSFGSLTAHKIRKAQSLSPGGIADAVLDAAKDLLHLRKHIGALDEATEEK